MNPLCDVNYIRHLMKKYKLQFNKKYGQNFLTDEQVLDDIISTSGITPDDGALEILSLIHISHLLVDEFQDSNDVQFRLIRQWAQENIFIIGDPDQSIYGFRGSDARCFERFFDAYPDTVQILSLIHI